MITLLGQALSNQQIYGQSGKIKYLKKKAVLLKRSWIEQARSQRVCELDNFFTEDISMFIRLYHGDRRKRDIDNFSKQILDSLTGIVYEDDSQIKKIEIEKFYDKSCPRVEIFISKYIDETGSKNK